MTFEDVEVIDWDEAMQQCGDDEEFLLELLGDLRDETDMQMKSMEETIKELTEPTDQFFLGISRAAHVIKGAASNLMCEQLRVTAMALESAGQAGNNLNDKEKKTKLKDEEKKMEEEKIVKMIREKFVDLKGAVSNYHDYLKDVLL